MYYDFLSNCWSERPQTYTYHYLSEPSPPYPKSKTHFKAGDVVQLKSGGPSMVVDSHKKHYVAVCVWMDSNGVKRQYGFNPETLRKAS